MPKKNTPKKLDGELERIHSDFICDLMTLLEETDEHRGKVVDIEKKLDSKLLEKNIVNTKTELTEYIYQPDSKPLIEEKVNVTHKTKIIYASHFCYIHALFERYLFDLLINSIKSNNKIKERYFNKFEEVGMTTDYKHLIKFTKSFDQRLSRINDIASASDGIIKLCKYMFNVKKLEKTQERQKGTDYGFHQEYANYIEMRERYNLIKHRGNRYDEYYVRRVEKLLKLHSQKIDPNTVFERVFRTKNKNPGKYLINKEIIIDPQYFATSIKSMIYISQYLLCQAYDDVEVRVHHINHVIHNLLLVNYKNRSLDLYALIMNLCNLFGPKFKERPDIIQFNTILAHTRECKLINEILKPNKSIVKDNKNTLKKYNQGVIGILKEYVGVLKFNDDYKTLLKLYIEDKKEEFINHCFSMNLVKDSFQSWSIFQDFRKNSLFLSSFKKKFKNEYKPESFPISVSVTKDK